MESDSDGGRYFLCRMRGGLDEMKMDREMTETQRFDIGKGRDWQRQGEREGRQFLCPPLAESHSAFSMQRVLMHWFVCALLIPQCSFLCRSESGAAKQQHIHPFIPSFPSILHFSCLSPLPLLLSLCPPRFVDFCVCVLWLCQSPLSCPEFPPRDISTSKILHFVNDQLYPFRSSRVSGFAPRLSRNRSAPTSSIREASVSWSSRNIPFHSRFLTRLHHEHSLLIFGGGWLSPNYLSIRGVLKLFWNSLIRRKLITTICIRRQSFLDLKPFPCHTF